jgi:hypothetical protein
MPPDGGALAVEALRRAAATAAAQGDGAFGTWYDETGKPVQTFSYAGTSIRCSAAQRLAHKYNFDTCGEYLTRQ